MKKITEKAKEMFENKSFSSYEIDTFLEILTTTDELYYNGEESFLTDKQYDFLRKYSEQIDPSNVYFTGIGSEVRGGKVKLPYPMGSLDQVDEGDFETWVRKHNLQNEKLVLTDKLDGTSALIIFDKNGDMQIAYSRGDGTEGADITRHLNKLGSIPNNTGKALVVRGEVIIEKSSFPWLRAQIKTRGNTKYKNPRNMVAGLMNSKENPKVAYDFIKFVAYQIVGSTESKEKQLNDLIDMGFAVPYSLTVKGSQADDLSLINGLKLRKQDSLFEIDGLVIDVNSEEKRSEMNPTKYTLNPAYAIKYKVNEEDAFIISTVLKIEWNLSKHGFLKPRINIESMDLGGVTISYCTGFNAKYIYDNKIRPGTKIKIIRSGDVIPFCVGVVEECKTETNTYYQFFEEELNKFGKWSWNETSVDVVILNADDNEEVAVKRMIDFFEKIKAPMLKEGNIKKLYEVGKTKVEDVIMCPRDAMYMILGENGNKAYDGLINKLSNIKLHVLMGAHSNHRGIGIRKMKKLQKDLGSDNLLKCRDVDVVAGVEGFDIKSAEQAIKVIRDFNIFLEKIKAFVGIADDEEVGSQFENEKICMTGFRDADMQSKIEGGGGMVQTSVTGKTTLVVCKDPTSNSGKVKKAKELGIPVISIEELTERLSL